MPSASSPNLERYLRAPAGSSPPVLTARDVRRITGKTSLTAQERQQLKDLYEAVSVGRVVASPEAVGLLRSTLNNLGSTPPSGSPASP